MRKRKINIIRLSLIGIILILIISNIYLLIDKQLNYISKDNLLSLIEENNGLTTRLLEELFPNKSFYYKDNKLVIDDVKSIINNSYDFNRYLDTSGNLFSYNDPKLKTKIGIDVSSNNGDIDWSLVKESGIDFAIIRLGYRGYSEGKLYLDSYFEKNMKGAISAGLDVGVYFFSQALNEEEINEEVDFVLENIKNYTFKYPVVFDMEEIDYDVSRTNNITKDTVTNLTRIFIDRISNKGYKTMIYGNRNWLMGMLDLSKFEDVDKWLALYSDSPYYDYEFVMWQYTEIGKIEGIENYVDINISFKEY